MQRVLKSDLHSPGLWRIRFLLCAFLRNHDSAAKLRRLTAKIEVLYTVMAKEVDSHA